MGAAFVKIFPPLHEIGTNMGNNFEQWAKLRIEEIRRPPTIVEDADEVTVEDAAVAGKKDAAVTPVMDQAQQHEEVKKLEERMQKFKDKLAFLAELRGLNQRKRTSFVTSSST